MKDHGMILAAIMGMAGVTLGPEAQVHQPKPQTPEEAKERIEAAIAKRERKNQKRLREMS